MAYATVDALYTDLRKALAEPGYADLCGGAIEAKEGDRLREIGDRICGDTRTSIIVVP